MEIPMKNFKYTWRYPRIRCEEVHGEFQGVVLEVYMKTLESIIFL